MQSSDFEARFCICIYASFKSQHSKPRVKAQGALFIVLVVLLILHVLPAGDLLIRNIDFKTLLLTVSHYA